MREGTSKKNKKGYATLAVAILKSAVVEGDVDFFDTEWAEILVQIANIGLRDNLIENDGYAMTLTTKLFKEYAMKNKIDIFSFS